MLRSEPLAPPVSWVSAARSVSQANTSTFAKQYAGAAKNGPGRRMERKVRKRFILRLLLVFMRRVSAYAHYVLEQNLVVAQILSQFLVVVLKAYARELAV